MTNNQIGDQFLESFVDVATELLAYNKQKSNPPTPSLNDFSESELREEEIIITNEEADQILNILQNLQDELESKDKKIKKLQTKVNKTEKANKTEAKKGKPNKAQPRKDFKSELSEHAETLDLITVLIQSGSDCCKLTGNVFRVYSDFIVLLDEDNDLIKIQIAKIAAIKVIDPNKKKENDCTTHDADDLENDESSNELNIDETKQDLKAI